MDLNTNLIVLLIGLVEMELKPGKIIIPWVIEGPATLFEGTVTFAF